MLIINGKDNDDSADNEYGIGGVIMRTLSFPDIAGKKGLFVDGDWIEKKDQDAKGKVRLIQLADIGSGAFLDKSDRYITEDKACELHCTFLRKGDVLIARLGEPICKCCLFPFEGNYITAVDVAILRIGRDDINPKYLVYLINSPWFKNRAKEFESGTTRKRISRKNMEKILLPFPSLDEQARIVARIEELFSELDAGVDTLQKIKQQLAVYRQAVLSGAFSGELTGSAVRDYEILSEFIEKPRYGTSKKCSYEAEKGGIPVYRIPNIDHLSGCISSEDIKYATFNSSELNDLRLESGDLLIIRSNGSVSLVGRAAIVREEQLNAVFAGYLMRLRIKDHAKLLPRFLLHYLNSQQARTYIENKAKSTSGVHNINSKEISDLVLPIYSIEDQVKIIEAIESRTSLCDAIGKTVEQALQGSAAMRQSILKQAFEGGL